MIEEVAIKLWEYSETALQETQSVNLLINKLSEAGFSIETNVAGMPTAFIATYGSDGLDAVIDWHPSTENEVRNQTGRAMNSFEVEFFG